MKKTVILDGPGTVRGARRDRLHRALDAAIDEKLTSVQIPGHKGNVPNVEYKIPPKPTPSKDEWKTTHGTHIDVNSSGKVKKGPAALKASTKFRKKRWWQAKDADTHTYVGPASTTYCAQCGEARGHANHTKATDRRAKLHAAVDRAFDAKHGGKDTSYGAVKAGLSAKCATCGASNGEHSASNYCPDESQKSGFSKTNKWKPIGKAKNSRDAYHAPCEACGYVVGHHSECPAKPKKTTDSENKSIAPIPKLIPRSKRPMGKDVSASREAVIKKAAGQGHQPATIAKFLGMNADEVRKILGVKGKDKEPSPFERDTDAGAARIVKREAKAGSTVAEIVKKYGFSKSFVEEEYQAKGKGKDAKFTWTCPFCRKLITDNTENSVETTAENHILDKHPGRTQSIKVRSADLQPV